MSSWSMKSAPRLIGRRGTREVREITFPQYQDGGVTYASKTHFYISQKSKFQEILGQRREALVCPGSIEVCMRDSFDRTLESTGEGTFLSWNQW